MPRTETTRLLIGMFGAACLIVAAIFAAAGHVCAARLVSADNDSLVAQQVYWREAFTPFFFGGLFGAFGLLLIITAVAVGSVGRHDRPNQASP